MQQPDSPLTGDTLTLWKEHGGGHQPNRSRKYERGTGKSWKQRNPEKVKEAARRWRQRPHVKAVRAIRRRLAKVLNGERVKGNGINCTGKELRDWIEFQWEDGMTWDNYGEWHIDHIRPISSYPDGEKHLANNWQNLRPLWAEENIKKGAHYDPENPVI